MSFPQRHRAFIHPWLAAAVLAGLTVANLPAQQKRVSGAVDNSRRIALRGHVAPRVSDATDNGPIDPGQVIPYVTLAFRPTDAQQADLEALLAHQQDPSSPDYHKWLTPEQYADRFGANPSDIDAVKQWLAQQNLTVTSVARTRQWIAFGGTAEQLEKAFATPIHRFELDGDARFANTTDPTIPAAFSTLVAGIHGLDNFHLRPPRRQPVTPLQPNYNSSRSSAHYLAPDDVSVLYNVKPLLGAGYDGTGQKIVIVGQTNINVSDIQQFRSYFNLPASDPQILLVPGSKDPGVNSDEAEADLDIEWSGAVARNASIIYVYSNDVIYSAQYAIDQALAPVLSMSYGLCEGLTSTSEAKLQQALARQANAQGMTWVNASGDAGAADCIGSSTRTSYGVQVDVPAAIPEVTGIGGTTFTEGSGSYWNAANDANNSSVMAYIPETSWNDTALDRTPSASGGGASTYWLKPSWQTGQGVPTDNARDVPDVSLSASADHDAYMLYSGGKLGAVGGTSVGTPVFAGMLALLNHYLTSTGAQANAGLGNVNPRLYSLAQSTPAAFHDITTGDNIVNPCPSLSRSCTSTSVGFQAGVGYDQVTGLGSVDAYNLVAAWTSGTIGAIKGAASLKLAVSDRILVTTGSTNVTATVTAANGGTPTGSVTFSVGGTALGSANLTQSGSGYTASLALNGSQIPVGDATVTAQYSGDGSYGSSVGSIALTVVAAPKVAPAVSKLTHAASYTQAFAPGMIAAVFGSQLAPAVDSAGTLPLPAKLAGVTATVDGIAAPIYYASPGQLNIQIPYETGVNKTATLVIDNNGLSTSTTFRVTAMAPGIFVDSNGAPVPNTTGARGSVITLYITGEGAVSPALATGATPAASVALTDLPKPVQNVTVKVGGVDAPIQFVGIPSGLAGVTQINYQVPSSVAAGSQQVIVSVGGVASQAATLTVQ